MATDETAQAPSAYHEGGEGYTPEELERIRRAWQTALMRPHIREAIRIWANLPRETPPARPVGDEKGGR